MHIYMICMLSGLEPPIVIFLGQKKKKNTRNLSLRIA